MEHARVGVHQKAALDMLIADHRKVQKTFRAFSKSEQREKEPLVRATCIDLKIHTQIEEQLFYPALRKLLRDAVPLLDEAEEEHAIAKELVADLEQMHAGEPHYEAKFTVLGEYVNHHIKEEEEELFVRIKKSKIDLDEVAQRMAQLQEQLKRQHGVTEKAEA